MTIESNYAVDDDGTHHHEATRAVFITATPRSVPGTTTHPWTGAVSYPRPEPKSDAPERRTIDDPVEMKMRRDRLFSRTASFEDVATLSVTDPQVGELAGDLMVDRLIDLATTPEIALLDDWAGRHPDLVRTAEPDLNIDRASALGHPGERIAIITPTT